MKFTVSKSTLIKKLTAAMGSVSNKNTITAIEGVLIETVGDGLIQLSTYDMSSMIVVQYNQTTWHLFDTQNWKCP